MSNKPKIRQISRNIWSLEAISQEIPNMVLGVAPGKLKVKVEGFELDDPELTEINAENLKEVLAKSLIRLSDKVKNLETGE